MTRISLFLVAALVVVAALPIHVGETFDFRWTPGQSAAYTLQVITTYDAGAPPFERSAPPPDTLRIPIQVR